MAKDAHPKGEAEAPSSPGDIAVVYKKDQDGLHILRRRSEDAPVEAAIIEPLTEGRPITGEVISLRRRTDWPFAFDVKTELEGPPPVAAGNGPPQVSTDRYREGWDAIFGRKRIAARDLN